MSDTDCEKAGCKGWSMSPLTALDAAEVRLCPPHRRLFQNDPMVQELWAQKVRRDADERRCIARIYAGDSEYERDHRAAIEDVIAHQVKRRAFVLEWLAMPAPLQETESKETTT